MGTQTNIITPRVSLTHIILNTHRLNCRMRLLKANLKTLKLQDLAVQVTRIKVGSCLAQLFIHRAEQADSLGMAV